MDDDDDDDKCTLTRAILSVCLLSVYFVPICMFITSLDRFRVTNDSFLAVKFLLFRL